MSTMSRGELTAAHEADLTANDAAKAEFSELPESLLDRAFERVSGPREAEPEPSATELPAELNESERAVFLEAGVDHEQAAAFLEANPELAAHLIQEPQTDEELAANVRLLSEFQAGRGAQQVVSQVYDVASAEAREQFYEQALEALYDSDDGDLQGSLALAQSVAENTPDRLDEFVAEWAEFDPVGPHLFASQRQQQREQEHYAWSAAEVNRIEAEAEQAAQARTHEAFSTELRRLAKSRPDLKAQAGQLLQDVLAETALESPEQAVALVQTARRGAAEISDATHTAKLLGPLDRMLNDQGFADGVHEDGTAFKAFDRREALARTTAEQIGQRWEKLLPPGPSRLDGMVDGMDAFLAEREAMKNEYDAGVPEALAPLTERNLARRNRRW